MTTRFNRLALVALPLALSAIGCTDRRAIYDSAMLSTVSELRRGDLEGASLSLSTALRHADDDVQRRKVRDLSILIDGAESYMSGDRGGASATWSSIRAPELRRSLNVNQQSMGVYLSDARTTGGNP
jgi:hypothetical protein